MMADNLENISPSCSVVALFIGPMVAGTMIEQLLLGIICSQAIAYYRYHFKNDTSFCRSIVTCLVLFTVFLGVIDFMSLYRRIIGDRGDCDKFDLQDWIMWTEPSLTAWIAFVAHIFYIFRCWAVTHSLAVCIFLGVVALNSLISGITVTVFCFSLGRLSNLAGVVLPATIWFASTGACDLSIAAVLVLYLWRRGSILRSTNAMVTRLRRTSIETGSLTAVCALLNLILFVYMPDKGYDLLIQYSISHLYTLSVLYTLLGRQDLRNMLLEGSGSFVSDCRSSFLAAGVLSTTSLDNHLNSDTPWLRNRISKVGTYDDNEPKLEHTQGERNV